MRLIGDRLSCAYGDTKVLEDLDCRFAEGEAVAVIGPSGSGKTTLLSVLGGLLAPVGGRVYIGDGSNEIANVSGKVAWIHQTNHGLRRRSARDNVALGLMARGVPYHTAEGAAGQYLAAVQIAHRSSVSASRLSGGEMQRLAVARALALQAPFILADEPTGQLDYRSSERIADLLVTETTSRGQGVIIATHDGMLAERCHRSIDLAAYSRADG